MIVYIDTSAFVKLILEEEGAAEVRSWFGGARPALSSIIAYPETCSALGRRDRELGPSESRLRAWVAELDARWRRVVAVPVQGQAAGRLALQHRLRGMDAVHLSAAISFRERLSGAGVDEQVLFAAFDGQLREAAEAEGFSTLGGALS